MNAKHLLVTATFLASVAISSVGQAHAADSRESNSKTVQLTEAQSDQNALQQAQKAEAQQAAYEAWSAAQNQEQAEEQDYIFPCLIVKCETK